jgi:hypothetical protein
MTAAMRVTDQRQAAYDFVICISPASLNGRQLTKANAIHLSASTFVGREMFKNMKESVQK